MFLVHAHFYEGDQKAYCEEKFIKNPKNKIDIKFGVIGFKIFLKSKLKAERITQKIIDKKINLERFISKYLSDSAELSAINIGGGL